MFLVFLSSILKKAEVRDVTPLMKIQRFLQAYVQAISSILECDVTVVDQGADSCGGHREVCL